MIKSLPPYSNLKEVKEVISLDAETLKSMTDEVAGELGLPCKVESAAPLMGSTMWYIRFKDGHAPFYNDFREYVGAPYEEDLIKERIKNYLVSQHAPAEGLGR